MHAHVTHTQTHTHTHTHTQARTHLQRSQTVAQTSQAGLEGGRPSLGPGYTFCLVHGLPRPCKDIEALLANKVRKAVMNGDYLSIGMFRVVFLINLS